MSRPWRTIDSGLSTGAHNMAVDELLLTRVAESGGAPVLRFYTWRPPAVSIGSNQTAATELDLARCSQQGIDVVRRPSGGRAVLHWNELTYSLLWIEDEPSLAGGVSESCRRIGECLVAGLQLFGVAAELEQGDRGRGGAAPTSAASKGPCFASTSRWEITCGGKKLVGSAQRRIRGGVLQHGSLLLGPEHLRLGDLMRTDHVLPQTSTHLACWVNHIDLEQLMESLLEGFARTLDVDLEPTALSPEETATAAQRAHRFSIAPPLTPATTEHTSAETAIHGLVSQRT